MKLRMPKLRSQRSEARSDAEAGASGGPAPAPVAASLLRGYGPLAAFAILFVLMAGFVPTVDEDLSGAALGGVTADDGGPGPVTIDPDTGEAIIEGVPTTGGSGGTRSGGSGGSATPAGGGATTAGEGSGTQAAPEPGRGQGSCAGKESQVPGDPYAPPCVEWAGGDNGGATHRGVDAETVKISFRVINERGFLQTLATLAGADIVDKPEDIKRTIDALEEFFNAHYQFYGRQIEIIDYPGSGSTTTELLGGGRAEAAADAKHAAQEIGAFIEMNAASEPFAHSIAEQGVIGFGTPYLSRKWHNDRRPYAWSVATDCSIVAEVAAELAVKTLAGKPAEFAGGAQQGQERVLAGLSPENEWYGVCHDAARDVISNAGHDPGLKVRYKLDINSMSSQASSIIAQFKNGNATTVLCGCDPIFPVFLSAKAAEQNYHPEWVVLGTALTDWDVSGQLYDQEQWSRAFGVSSLGEPHPIRAGLGYTAYKTVRDDEPAFAVELIYGTLLLISTGIQMAGPNLDPLTFEQGLKNWPGGTGPYGTWGFGPQDYTPTRDYRVIWWNPDAISIVNSQPGAYITAYDHQRYPPGSLPSGDLKVFGK